MKIIRTKGLEVCPKTPYLCTTPQGRDGYFERKNHEKKKGLTRVERGNRKKRKEKKLEKVFGS
ncbi:hypothetical protein, partial [Sphingobacterium sp.]|uniref:hypothetical protein n=1 Tax=Sphingobacterium sp. TaxID=341027 RepID=UPI0028A645E5